MTKNKSKDILQSLQSVQSSGFEQLRRENSYLKKLLDVSRQISTLDLMQSLQLIIDNVVNITEAQRGFLMLLDEEKKLEIKVSSPSKLKFGNAAEMAICKSISQQVAVNGKSRLIEDIALASDIRDRKSVIDLELKAMMCVPLISRGDCIGIIYIDSDRKTHRFSSADLELFEAFASQAAVALANAHMFEELKRDHFFYSRKFKGFIILRG